MNGEEQADEQTADDIQAEVTARINDLAHVGRVKPWLRRTTGAWQRDVPGEVG